MTHQDWINLFAPSVAALVLAAGATLGAIVTGVAGKARAYFQAHGQSAAAQAVAAAGDTINQALMTGAGTIAGKIQTGQLDYTNRAALEAEATREVSLAETRVPAALAIAAPIPGALVANLMSKVDALVVASPTMPTTAPATSISIPVLGKVT